MKGKKKKNKELNMKGIHWESITLGGRETWSCHAILPEPELT